MSIHNGHRQRVKEKFLDKGLDGMHPHEVLEFLLFFSVPRGDTNPIAHNLIKRFGNIAGVFDAQFEELMKIEGIGVNSAMLIKAVPQFMREYAQSTCELKIINSSKSAGEYFLPKFIGRTEETFFAVLLDNKSHILKDVLISTGSVNQVNVNIRRMVELSLKHQAAVVILAHNHPNGRAKPSMADISTTNKIKSALALVGITLSDHIIVANEDYISLADEGRI